MTEDEWLERASPGLMLRFLGDRASARKLRLFACNCAEFVWRSLLQQDTPASLELAWTAVEAPESLPKSTSPAPRSRAAPTRSVPELPYTEPWSKRVLDAASGSPDVKTLAEVRSAVEALAVRLATDNGQDTATASQEARTELATFIRDIFGNPFRPVAADPSWLTSTVVALARGIYADRAFDRLPILADALQDAGCDNADMLDHCRSDGPHVRGCWVVDLVLGLS